MDEGRFHYIKVQEFMCEVDIRMSSDGCSEGLACMSHRHIIIFMQYQPRASPAMSQQTVAEQW